MKRLTHILLLALVLAGVLAMPVLAQSSNPPTADDINAVAKQLYCPVCENTPLDVCPTQACAQWRALIGKMLSEGKSEQEIKDYFVANYGARVLNEPPRKGLNWLIYIIPPVTILAGALFLFRAMQTWRKQPAPVQAKGSVEASLPDDYVAKLEEELKNRK